MMQAIQLSFKSIELLKIGLHPYSGATRFASIVFDEGNIASVMAALTLGVNSTL